jgi:hypothetical protein
MTETAANWWAAGLRLRRKAHETPARYVTISGIIGFKGLAAGREVTFIDFHALADSLLAQLPLKESGKWRIAHLRRPIPLGYVYARKTDSLDQMDPPLREYYRHLRLIVSGPIFNWERLHTIVDFHLGRYDHLLDQWRTVAGLREIRLKDASRRMKGRTEQSVQRDNRKPLGHGFLLRVS